jgi:hypothetical protein
MSTGKTKKNKKNHPLVGNGATVRQKGDSKMKSAKQNISLPRELYDYVQSRVEAINREGKQTRATTNFSSQIAVAIEALMMQEESPQYGSEGNAQAPRTPVSAQSVRIAAPSTNPRQPAKTSRK